MSMFFGSLVAESKRNKVETVLPYVLFEGTSTFTLSAAYHIWDGTVEYSTDNSTWTTWGTGETIGGTNTLYLRGTGNTRFATGSATTARTNFVFNTTGTISASGRIDNLLDYQTVANGGTPNMSSYCYYYMFYNCTSLVTAPDLTATTLASYCYASLFRGCTSLITAPDLPATTLASYCYAAMFYGCTSLITASELPTSSLYGYYYCYQYMFYGCTSLTEAPDLIATTLANYCYQYMFYGCTSLTEAPSIAATTLASYCCYNMFRNCTSLKVSEINVSNYNYTWRIPSNEDDTISSEATSWNTNMLIGTGGDFKGDPSINTFYYLDIS